MSYEEFDDFERAFSEFLDRHEYDEAENYLFSLARLAFAAGWRAAGGAAPKLERIYPLLPPTLPRQEERRPGRRPEVTPFPREDK